MEKTEAVGGGLIVPSWPEFREPKFDVQPWHGALRDDISGEPAWYGYANPSDAQKKPSCGGHAAANCIEVLLRISVPEPELHAAVKAKLGHLRWQLDGERFWRLIRDTRYGNYSGGMTMEDVSSIPKLIGAPLDVVRVAKSERCEAVRRAPVVIGLATWRAWRTPDPSSGYIPPQLPDPWSGHAVCLVAIARQRGRYDVFLNSWGEKWGRYGYGMLNAGVTSYAWLDDGVQFIPARDDWWQTWDWIEWVVAHE